MTNEQRREAIWQEARYLAMRDQASISWNSWLDDWEPRRQLSRAMAAQNQSIAKSYRAERYTCGTLDTAVWLDGGNRIIITYGVNGTAPRREEFHSSAPLEFLTLYLKFGAPVEDWKAWEEYHAEESKQ